LSLVDEAQGYIPHPDLQAAVNLALVLGKPLLITGEPGTGKTRLAESVRWQLGLKNLFKFVYSASIWVRSARQSG
jgi:MoxR-like ATPase